MSSIINSHLLDNPNHYYDKYIKYKNKYITLVGGVVKMGISRGTGRSSSGSNSNNHTYYDNAESAIEDYGMIIRDTLLCICSAIHKEIVALPEANPEEYKIKNYYNVLLHTPEKPIYKTICYKIQICSEYIRFTNVESVIIRTVIVKALIEKLQQIINDHTDIVQIIEDVYNCNNKPQLKIDESPTLQVQLTQEEQLNRQKQLNKRKKYNCSNINKIYKNFTKSSLPLLTRHLYMKPLSMNYLYFYKPYLESRISESEIILNFCKKFEDKKYYEAIKYKFYDRDNYRGNHLQKDHIYVENFISNGNIEGYDKNSYKFDTFFDTSIDETVNCHKIFIDQYIFYNNIDPFFKKYIDNPICHPLDKDDEKKRYLHTLDTLFKNLPMKETILKEATIVTKLFELFDEIRKIFYNCISSYEHYHFKKTDIKLIRPRLEKIKKLQSELNLQDKSI